MRYFLTLFFLTTSSLALFAQAPDTSAFVLRFAKQDSVYLNQVTNEFNFQQGIVSKTGDLNGDTITDYVVYFGACGNWGDCVFGIFVGSQSGKYKCLFEDYLPPFALSPSFTTHNGLHWQNIEYTERVIDAHGNPTTRTKLLVFDGEKYVYE